jgi:hypothetical protein
LRVAYPPYDFLIVLSATLLLGLLLRKSLFKKQHFDRGIDKLFPYGLIYIPISLLFAFIVDDLPLKFYGSSEIVYDPQKSSGLGPQTVNMKGIVSAGIYLLSVVFNFLVWIFCAIIIIRHYTAHRKPVAQQTSFLDE